MTEEIGYTEEELRYIARLAAPMHKGVLTHPLMEALKTTSLSGEQIKKFCDIRYNAASEFIPLLKRTYELAHMQHRPKLAEAIRLNMCDEFGLDPATGQKYSEPMAHSDWRKDFLDAMGIETTHSNHFPLYAFAKIGDLPMMVGKLLAAESVIPREDDRILRSVCKAFPRDFIDLRNRHVSEDTRIALLGKDEFARRKRNSLYLADHIDHDPKRHLRDLVKAIFADLAPEEREAALKGAQQLYDERKGLYTHIQQQIGLETPARQAMAV